MIRKQADEHGEGVLVTFELPGSIWAHQVALVGDFNDWNPTTHPLIQTRSNENWHITLTCTANRAYRFRYLFDGRAWSNDPQADEFAVTDDAIPCNESIGSLERPSSWPFCSRSWRRWPPRLSHLHNAIVLTARSSTWYVEGIT